MKKEVNLLYGQLIIFIMLLFYFVISGDPLALFVSLAALVMVILFYFYFYKKNFRINHIGSENKL